LQQGAIAMSCIKTLKEKGLKLTPQRLLIANIIHGAKGHLIAGEIVKHVQNKMPGVNKSTIYRTLDILEEAGCIYKSEMDKEIIYHHDDHGHHHHLVCLNCGKTIDCDEGIFESMQKSLMNKYAFFADTKHVMVNGICGECKKKNN
jgi:Fur family ferric uptake transcriptional regulator